jgi:hypothetical protein
MKNTFVHVEVLDKSMNAEYIVAMTAEWAQLMFMFVGGSYYTQEPIGYVMMIPGSFIVRKRKFENERIS